ncbi:MAG: hypothetical protein KME26_25720 [Oscillatoria princeps RMCB-10]|jgi:multidrug transporter EmrE-like cation transporter|nr:hypothetical protein [Oscillatoria princeps RMCB-10]
MKTVIIVALATKLTFIIGEIPAAACMSKLGFHLASLHHPWFSVFFVTRLLGIVGQLYLWSEVPLGQVAALLGVFGLVLNNLLGAFFLHQHLSPSAWAGIGLAVASILLLTSK